MCGLRRIFFVMATAGLLQGGLFLPRCSTIFKYFRDLSGSTSGQSGLLEFENDGSGTYDLELQMAFTASNVSSDWFVTIVRTSSKNEILNGKKIVYSILFPENQRTQTTRPSAISVFFNNEVYCKDPVPGNAFNVSTTRNLVKFNTSLKPQSCTNCGPRQSQSTGTEIRISNQAECGIKSDSLSLIFEGRSTRKGEFPWLVALFYKEGNTYSYKCAGTLISNRHVITAAHCATGIDEKKVFAVFEGHSIYVTANSTMKNIKKIVVHPEFKKISDADIAVIVINPIPIDNVIKPACLWDEPIGLTEAEMGSIAGARDGKIPCLGDSGSGFVIERNKRWKLRGVVSSALNDGKTCDGDNYAVFADVPKYATWLNKILQEN